jgi:hypothetical protein
MGDLVGYDGIIALSNGNYVAVSPNWENGAAEDAGAVTWGDGSTGTSGPVSEANSLVGSTTWGGVGSGGVTALSNGNYVVAIPNWGNGDQYFAGAVTWGNGVTGTSGEVSAANSLVGSTESDQIGYCGFNDSNCVTALSNGNYVVASPHWDNGAAADAGAVTWVNGATGLSEVISEANSLVGRTAGDQAGCRLRDQIILNGCNNGVTALSNGNYVVASPYWHNGATADAGAVTWGNGATGVSGAVSAANSLVGSTMDDKIGFYLVTALSNGNYVSASPYWDNGAELDAGAVTWGNGSTGRSGSVSAANSLVGTFGDRVGCYGDWTDPTDPKSIYPCYYGGVTALSNGNFVVVSPRWQGSGAVTWGNGATGVSGVVSEANSLVGSSDGDKIGFCEHSNCVAALSSGNYVVVSPYWDDGPIADAGAVTWGNGATGVSGWVSADNSLVGSTYWDGVGSGGVTALSNGNYVVVSNKWHNGAAADAGAVTWGNGSTGTSGMVSAANSLVGSTNGDSVGNYGVTALSNGNYMITSPRWQNGAGGRVGAVTWGNGSTGTSGAVSAANSLVGSTAGDEIGTELFDSTSKVFELNNGNYVVWSPDWDNGTVVDGGAVTLGNGIACAAGFTLGPISAANSVLGEVAGGGVAMNFNYDPVNRQIVVGRLEENIVSLFRDSECAYHLFAPVMNK